MSYESWSTTSTPLKIEYPRLNAQEALARTVLPEMHHTVSERCGFFDIGELYNMNDAEMVLLSESNDAAQDDELEVGEIIVIPEREQILAFEVTHDVEDVVTDTAQSHDYRPALSLLYAEGRTGCFYDTYQLALWARGEITVEDYQFWDKNNDLARNFAKVLVEDSAEAALVTLWKDALSEEHDALGPVVIACANAAAHGDIPGFIELLRLVKSPVWIAFDGASTTDDDGDIPATPNDPQEGRARETSGDVLRGDTASTPEPYWPSTIDVSVGGGPGNFDVGAFKEHSGMWLCGYRTGKTEGLSGDVRRDVLANFMERNLHPDIKRIHGDDYGGPLSMKRLMKVANTLAAQCRNYKRRANADSYSVAIAHCGEDLAFLKERYFDQFVQGHPHLSWPDTEL